LNENIESLVSYDIEGVAIQIFELQIEKEKFVDSLHVKIYLLYEFQRDI